MKKRLYLIIIINILFTLFSCKKEICIISNECLNYKSIHSKIDTLKLVSYPENCASIFGAKYSPMKQFGYFAPIVCSSHNSELFFLEKDYTNLSNSFSLFSLNLCTSQKTKLCTDILLKPSISKKGWLIFTRTDNQLWKMKCNGDSLTQVSNNNSINSYPIWNNSKDLFCFRYANGGYYQCYIANDSGTILDSIPQFKNYTEKYWVDDNIYAISPLGGSNIKIDVYNLITKKSDNVISINLPPNESINSLFVNENQSLLFWSTINNFNILTLNTNTSKAYNVGRSNTNLVSFSISKDEQNILFNRVNINMIDSCNFTFANRIYIAKIDNPFYLKEIPLE